MSPAPRAGRLASADMADGQADGTAAAVANGASTRPRAVRAVVVLGVVVLALLGLQVASVPLGIVPAASGLPTADSIGNAEEGIAVGQRAPAFATVNGRPGLTDLDGRPIELADFAGRPLWIVFWATWCTPCQLEAPDILASFHAHEPDGLAVLAIDIQEPTVAAREYALAHGLDYTIGLDATAAIKTQYGAPGLPSHVFIDRTGVIRERYSGQLTADLMEQHLAPILGD